MRTERDFLGEVKLPANALYGIHSLRAAENFPNQESFHIEWYKATGTVKLSAYKTVQKFRRALETEHPDLIQDLNIPSHEILDALHNAAVEVSKGEHFEHFIIPAIQGGAGTSINLNINEIICNRALQISGHKAGEYQYIDPIEAANIYQSTNDVIPTALTVAIMELLNTLEAAVNATRQQTEMLEKKFRNTLRLSFTQLQEAVPGTYGQLFSGYSGALSRDWWRISKAKERIKQINLGGGATGTGVSIPRFYIMEVGSELRKMTGLPLAQNENLSDGTSNHDSLVEVHAILKAHAVNMEKMVNDLRLLASGLNPEKELILPAKQTGSSIMPGKINPVIPEFVISSAHHIYANDQLITGLVSKGELDLNAFLPSIGHAFLQSLKLLIAINDSLEKHLLNGIEIHEEIAASRLYNSPAACTALSPIIGYNEAARLAKLMKAKNMDIFQANKELNILTQEKLDKLMKPEFLLKKGFTVKDIREFNEE